MMKRILAFVLAISGTAAQADDWDAAEEGYNKSYLQVEECFARGVTDREACVMGGIQACVERFVAFRESKGLLIPGGVEVSPEEFCNHIGLERADEHLNAVYQRILKQGPVPVGNKEETIATLRNAQRLWLQYANEMCSEDNIVGWHAGGSDRGAVTDECTTRLSIQQADHLERFFTLRY